MTTQPGGCQPRPELPNQRPEKRPGQKDWTTKNPKKRRAKP